MNNTSTADTHINNNSSNSPQNIHSSVIHSTTPPPAPKWWFGGVAAMWATICTHPLDTIKIRMQTSIQKTSLSKTVIQMIKAEGVFSLYSGLSASLLRQATYSTARFAVYDAMKLRLIDENGMLSPLDSLLAGIVGGCAGGIVGTPADLVNIRMQNDGKLKPELKRNYKNGIDGILRIIRDEGFLSLFTGVNANVTRAIFMTSSQIASYDIIKQQLISTSLFDDSTRTHFVSSLLSGLIATTVTSPVDVLKTRVMASSSSSISVNHTGASNQAINNRRQSIIQLFKTILRHEGPAAFLKGWLPSYTRLGPHTMLMFFAYEQIRKFQERLSPLDYKKILDNQRN